MSDEQQQPARIAEPGVYVGYLPAGGWAMVFGIFTACTYSSWPYVPVLATGAAAASLLMVLVESCRMVVHGYTTGAAMKRMFDAEREAFLGSTREANNG